MLGMFAALFPVLWFKVLRCNSKSLEMDEEQKSKLYRNLQNTSQASHYENNMCVQYPSEEEYMQSMLLHEQKKMAEKIRADRERWFREDQLQKKQQQNSLIDIADDSMDFIGSNDHAPSSAPSEIRSLASPKSKKSVKNGQEELLEDQVPVNFLSDKKPNTDNDLDN